MIKHILASLGVAGLIGLMTAAAIAFVIDGAPFMVAALVAHQF